ncbi:terminase small subunit [uncultured Deinococcus sp.]|uniref:terminase small subunit n=1 Tax=uncultured Deinococcus sp. TaxID=158789 RepID=UPI00258A7616|nr:terminase small subunit [uncultured Deinococcus sp.]
MSRLTDRQRIFCENLNRGMSATEAAREAGYGEAYANREANRLVDKPQVKAYLDELRADSRTQAVADGTEIREYLTSVLRDKVKDVATGGKELEFIHTPMPASERTKAAQELAKLDGHYAPTRVDVKLTEYSRDWLKQSLAVIGRHVTPETLRQIAAELPRFEP